MRTNTGPLPLRTANTSGPTIIPTCGTCSAERWIGVTSVGTNLLRDAVAVLVAPQVGGDQLGEKADRHHLGAQEQGDGGINEQRPLTYRLAIVRVNQPYDPGDPQPKKPQGAKDKAQQADAAKQV